MARELFGGDYFHYFAVVESVIQGHDAPVDPRSGALMAYLGMHAIGKINRAGTLGQFDDCSFGGEHKHGVIKQVYFQRFHKLSGIFDILLPFQYLAQPGQFLISLRSRCCRPLYSASGPQCRIRRCGAFPRCGFAPQKAPAFAYQGGVQGLVHIGLGGGNIVQRLGKGFHMVWIIPNTP